MRISPEELQELEASGAALLRSEKKTPKPSPRPAKAVEPDTPAPDIQLNTYLLQAILSELKNKPAPVITVTSPEVVVPERKPINVIATVLEHNSKGRIKTVRFQEV
jgi:hypothetical protein